MTTTAITMIGRTKLASKARISGTRPCGVNSFSEKLGVGNGNRTRNRRSHSPVLCQLSYSHRHCDYSNCDSELSEFTRAAGRYRKRGDCIPKQESRLSGLFLVMPVFTIFFVVDV